MDKYTIRQIHKYKKDKYKFGTDQTTVSGWETIIRVWLGSGRGPAWWWTWRPFIRYEKGRPKVGGKHDEENMKNKLDSW